MRVEVVMAKVIDGSTGRRRLRVTRSKASETVWRTHGPEGRVVWGTLIHMGQPPRLTEGRTYLGGTRGTPVGTRQNRMHHVSQAHAAVT